MVWSWLREGSSRTRPRSIDSCTDATSTSGTWRSRNVDDLREVVAGVDVHHREREVARPERLAREVQQHDRVLAAGEQQHRLRELGRHLADDVDRLGFELVEMIQHQTAHSPSPRWTSNGTFLVQSMNSFIVSRPNSTGRARSRTASSNSLVPTRAAKALNPSPSVRSASYLRIQRSTASGHALGRQAHLQAGAVDDLPAFVVAADVRDVGGDRVLADLDRGAVEPDVADVVLAAAVRAAGHLDVDARASAGR